LPQDSHRIQLKKGIKMTSTYFNPALYEEPRNQPIKVTPLSSRESLLTWLENTGRLQPFGIDELPDLKIPEDLDDILDPKIDGLEDEEE
jgi:Protein of unknown function (DUF3134)